VAATVDFGSFLFSHPVVYVLHSRHPLPLPKRKHGQQSFDAGALTFLYLKRFYSICFRNFMPSAQARPPPRDRQDHCLFRFSRQGFYPSRAFFKIEDPRPPHFTFISMGRLNSTEKEAFVPSLPPPFWFLRDRPNPSPSLTVPTNPLWRISCLP